MNGTIKELYAHNYINKNGLMSEKSKRMLPIGFYKREFSRMFGNAKIDIVIDFSGYVPFWTTMFAFSNAKKQKHLSA